ncbi:MAG: response regulator [Bacteroidia bacterium]|nr:response regulator [Bacteroidia bacterium]
MKKILVIDDSEITLKLIQNILHKSHPDYVVLLAHSGEEGFELAISDNPEIIILDILMSGLDGFETCQKIKSVETTSLIPVIMLSTLGNNPEVRAKGLETGADAFISKPFSKFEFIALVNVMLRIKNAEDKLRKQNQELENYIRNQIIESHQAEDRFLQISGYALEFLWEVNSDGHITYISSSLEKILGITPDEIIGKMFNVIIPYFRKTKRLSSLLNLDKKNAINFKDEKLIFRHRNGKKIWMSVSGFPVFNENNELISYRGVCQDITERVKAETDLQERMEEIKEYQKKLKKLNADLTDVEEKERRRIAEYLHDGMSQTLSLVHIKLTSLLNSELHPKTGKTIRESVDLINTAIKEARTLIYELSPPILFELGLLPAIRWRLEILEEKHMIETKLKCTTDTRYLSNDLKILIYRIANELIVNSIKHSGAGIIEVEIHKDLYYLCVSVTDNGKGFKYKSNIKFSDQGGFGLFNISERLDSIQGLLQFESKKNKGTKAIVRIPLEN